MRNSSLVEWSSAENVTGLKRNTEAAGCVSIGRGALCTGRSWSESTSGRYRRENAGMSSETCARNTGVLCLRFPGEGSSTQGKSGPKPRTEVVGDGEQAEIPAPQRDVNEAVTRKDRMSAVMVNRVG